MATRGGVCGVVYGAGDSPAEIWAQAVAKRAALPGFHQEFDRTLHDTVGNKPHSLKETVILDFAQGKWRESRSDSARVTVYNGTEFFMMEEGGDEYKLLHRSDKANAPLPRAYNLAKANWSQAKQVKAGPCGLSDSKDSCVLLEAPLPAEIRAAQSMHARVTSKTVMIWLDVDSGLILALRDIEQGEYDYDRGDVVGFVSDDSMQVKVQSHGAVLNPALFTIPEGAKKVSELKRWDAGAIKKRLAGKTAPSLSVIDLQGKRVELADLKGKTVLLDFFTTWCGPCLADAPSLDELYEKYGGKNLEIVGISVDEDRSDVEKFLKSHPHEYPIILASENAMPRPYQIGVFPTYVIIDSDGNVLSAAEGTQGFGELKHLLKKAGLEAD